METTSASGRLTVCSFHIPPGASWGKIKAETQHAIADWLAAKKGSLIFGIDANSPKVDHPTNPGMNVLWRRDSKDKPQLLAVPGLRDAYRVFVKDRPVINSEIPAIPPNGPLAISHYRHRGPQRTPCRYDFIFVSNDIAVGRVDYINTFENKLSDHALVMGDFDFKPLIVDQAT